MSWSDKKRFFIDLAQLLTIYLKIANIELFAFIWLEKSSILETHIKIFIILIKLIFQNNFFNKFCGIFGIFLEVWLLLLRKFGLRSYDQFCGSLALRAAIDGWSDFDSCISRTFIGHVRGCPMLPGYPNLIYMGLNHVSEDAQTRLLELMKKVSWPQILECSFY